MDLGVADPHQIQIVGYDIEQEPPWNFVQEDTFASWGQKLIYHGPLKPFEKVLLQKPPCAVVILCEQFLSQCLLVPIRGTPACSGCFKDTMGKVVPILCRWRSGDARDGAEDRRPGWDWTGSTYSRRCRVSDPLARKREK